MPSQDKHNENPNAGEDGGPSTQKEKDRIAKAIIAFKDALIHEEDASREQESRQDTSNKWIQVATLIFVILTTAGIFVQAVILHNTDEAIQKSAIAAQNAAIAAKDAVDATKSQMQLDQRAWLGVDSIRPDPFIPEIGKPFIVWIAFKNVGKTPARNIVNYGRGEPVLKGRSPNFSYSDVRPYVAGVLQPGGTAATTVAPMTVPGTNQSIIINDDLMNGMKSEQITIYVHGRFDYQDIFGTSHWVTYCANLIIPFNKTFGFCDGNNDTDDYQPTKK